MEPIAQGIDEYGPWLLLDASTGVPVERDGRPWLRAGTKIHRTRGPWWRFWGRWDERLCDEYRPGESVVFVGGPRDGTLDGVSPFISTLAFPVLVAPTLAARWCGEDEPHPIGSPPLFARAVYHRTAETRDGRTVFRYEA